MRTFIVHAHREPTSFNGALTRIAAGTLRAAGREVVVSDLYAMGFDPVSDRRNFVTVRNAVRRSSRSSSTAFRASPLKERAACLADYGRRVLSLSAGK